MLKMLLTGIAALLLATGTAHAEHAARIPSKMLGKWCAALKSEDTHGTWVYKRVNNWKDVADSSCSRLMLYQKKYWGQDGNSGPSSDCRIIGSITLLKTKENIFAKPNSGFQARYRCKFDGFSLIEYMIMHLDKDRQLITHSVEIK